MSCPRLRSSFFLSPLPLPCSLSSSSRPSTADSSSHQFPTIGGVSASSIRHSPSSRGAELTPSRLGPNSTPRGAPGRHSPGYPSPGTSLPSFENLSSGLPEDDSKRRRVMYTDQEPDIDAQVSYDRDGRNGSSRTGSAGLGQAPPLPETHRSSDSDFDGSASALARRRGDAAQAKVSRMSIDTGSATSKTSFEQGLHSGSARHWTSRPDQTSVAKSAPPSKISFDEREHFHSQPSTSTHNNSSDPESVRHPTYSASLQPISNHNGVSRALGATSQDPVRSNSSQEGSRKFQTGGREGIPPRLGLRGGLDDPDHRASMSPPTERRPLLPESSSQGSGRQAPGSARFVPQTATLPSPAYHTTSFMRQQHAGGPPQATPSASYPPRTSMPNPPPTARLPEHLRSPPSSKAQFLGLFASFYDSLGDSRTLKATLEDQVRRSNSLLHTLQRSSRVLEETVERKVRDERLVWEERTRRLEDRVRELEAKVGMTGPSPDDTAVESREIRIETDGASTTSLDAGAAASQNSSGGSATTTGNKRGGKSAVAKAPSTASTANKGKGKAAKSARATRSRRSSASASVTPAAGGAEANEDHQELDQSAQDEKSDLREASQAPETGEHQKKAEGERDELMEE